MSVYIIRPKTSVAESLDLASKKFTTESRQPQVEEVVDFWQENTVYKQIERWLEKANASNQVSIYPHYYGITGATVVEMPDDEAEMMRQELPTASILRDRPIKLIQPLRRKSIQQLSREHTLSHMTPARNLGDRNLPKWHLEHINLIQRRAEGYQLNGEKITVAVLDTGIDSRHQEFQGRVSQSYKMNDDGTIEELRVPQNNDTDGHGTHIAGLICGRNIGVAPNTKLIDCLLLPQGIGKLSNLVFWLGWLGLKEQANVNIANISAGIPEYFPLIQELISTLLLIGILPVCAVGNDGFNNHISPGNCKNSLSVGATDSNRQLAFFSGNGRLNINNQLYDVPYLVAPGVEVCSSVPHGGYEALDGTSMATAIASGVAALTLQNNLNNNNNITVGSLINQLRSNCMDLRKERERQGAGLIQVP
ncbi:MAG: S8 family peptidase [Nostoc sp. ChiSLP01]|nr:S8/S53 family peptidase [Nostoc sp. CmiSLP01]MDZ8286000.1 S8/S53 family peptidase [Nostoc sp. ChiSLP01]